MESKIRKLLYSYVQCKKDRDALYDEIGMARARIASIYGGCHSGSADDIHVLNGSVGDPVYGAVVGQVIPEREHLDRLLIRLAEREEVIIKVERLLDELDCLERNVVELRYFRKYAWEKVCECEYISRMTAYRIHDGAVKKMIHFDTN